MADTTNIANTAKTANIANTAAEKETMIKLTNIHKNFGPLCVLSGINLSVERGQVVSIIGPSGSGKSTVLRCVNGLEKIDRGIVEIEGVIVAAAGEEGVAQAPKETVRATLAKTGMVFQSFNLFPHKTALQNVMEALVVVKKMKNADARELGMEKLRRVGLDDKAESYPSRLSGGQKQRVAIARALAMEPDVMLFDEPTSALDPELVGEVLDVIKSLVREHMTMIIVSHEMGFTREVSDRVIFVDNEKIVADNPPDVFFNNPGHPRIASFLDKMLN